MLKKKYIRIVTFLPLTPSMWYLLVHIGVHWIFQMLCLFDLLRINILIDPTLFCSNDIFLETTQRTIIQIQLSTKSTCLQRHAILIILIPQLTIITFLKLIGSLTIPFPVSLNYVIQLVAFISTLNNRVIVEIVNPFSVILNWVGLI